MSFQNSMGVMICSGVACCWLTIKHRGEVRVFVEQHFRTHKQWLARGVAVFLPGFMLFGTIVWLGAAYGWW